MRGRITENSVAIYKHFSRLVKVPVIAVITGLEHEDSMQAWWTKNHAVFKGYGMLFDNHACVTTLRGKKSIFAAQYDESMNIVRDLITTHCSPDGQRAVSSWFVLTSTSHTRREAPTITFTTRIPTDIPTKRKILSKPLAPSIVRFPPPPSPADATRRSRTHRDVTVLLQGTINSLQRLAPVPGLQSLVGPTSDTDRSTCKPAKPEEKWSQTNYSSLSTTKKQAQDNTVSSDQSDTDSKLPRLYEPVSDADHLPTGAISKDPKDYAHLYPPGSTSHTPLPIAKGSNVFLPPEKGPTSVTVRTNRSKPLPVAPSMSCFPPPPSPADATRRSRTHTVLQGTINSLQLIQNMVALAPVPGLQGLVGVVLYISKVVDVSFGATYISQ